MKFKNKKTKFFEIGILILCLLAFIFTSFTVFTQNQLKNKYPILFIPGLQLKANDYKTLLTDLRKAQYQVIVFVPDDSNATNYQQLVNEWTKKIQNQLGDKKVILIGHSVGGSVATHFCSIDTRCVAGINLDGGEVYNEKIQVPFLYLQADAGNYCDQQCYQGRALMEKVASQPGVTFIHIPGIKHYNFTDLRTASLINQDYLGSIDGRNIIDTKILTFLQTLPKN